MLLHNVPLAGQMRNSDSSYTSNAREGTHGIWQSQLPITRWAIGTFWSVIVQLEQRQSAEGGEIDVVEQLVV